MTTPKQPVGRNYYPCKHKNLTHHSYMDGEVRVWICSFCAAHGRWGEGWSYFGNIECKSCEAAQMDEVRCPGCGSGQKEIA